MFAAILVSCLVLVATGLPIEIDEPQSTKSINFEARGGGYEGDMLLSPDDETGRGVGINGKDRRWPSNNVPYDISAITNADDRKKITDAMNVLMFAVATPIAGQTIRNVCVFFRPAQASDKQVLKIEYGNGCSASVGYNTQYEKSLNLARGGCFHSGTIQHELAHVLGFFHEQSRPDRDNFLTVHYENIESGMEHNFEKYDWGNLVEDQGTSYDYGSLMHYGTNFFTNNGKPTITPRQAGATIGQREKLSAMDIAEIRHYYKC